MAEVKKRKVHSADFKTKVALEAVRGVMPLNEVAQQFEVHPMTVRQWKKEFLNGACSVFNTKRGPKPAEHPNEDALYCEIGRLRMELERIKKSQGYEVWH